MEHVLYVKDVIGQNFTCEDAILLKGYIKSHLNDNVVLDFEGLGEVPTTFFYNLFSEMIYHNGRNFLKSHILVKNLSNPQDYQKVVIGINS